MITRKRKWSLALALVAVAIVATGLLSWQLVEPVTAHPGASCNPSAGHGDPGCHRSVTTTTKRVTTTTKRVTTTTKRATTTTAQPKTTTTAKAGTTTSTTAAANSTTTATAVLGATATSLGVTTSLDGTALPEDSTTSVTEPTDTTLEPTPTEEEPTTDTSDLTELLTAIAANGIGGGGGGGPTGGWIALLLVLGMLAAAGWALLVSKWAAGRRKSAGPKTDPLRFALAERLGHWSYALFFLGAGVTGALMWIPSMAERLAEAYFVVARYHGYLGLAMVIVPISISFILNRRRFAVNRRALGQWSAHDRRWLWIALTGGMFRGKRMPPQGRFNAGQKVNSYLVMTLTLAFLVTGSLLMVRGHLPGGMASGVLAGHKVLAVTGAVLLVGHAGMALFTRHGRGGLKAMMTGLLPAHIAREGHSLWYGEWLRHRRHEEAGV